MMSQSLGPALAALNFFTLKRRGRNPRGSSLSRLAERLSLRSEGGVNSTMNKGETSSL
jgi:hypothetical protein